MASRHLLCVDDLTAEPPAHDRLVSGHDPYQMVANLIVPPPVVRTSPHSLGETRALDIPPEPTGSGLRARSRRSRSAERPPAPRVALTAVQRGALQFERKKLGRALHISAKPPR
jgi:hypothetical protein